MGGTGWFFLLVLMALTSESVVRSEVTTDAAKLFSTECGRSKQALFSGVTRKAKPGSWPWMALIGYKAKKDSKPIWYRFGTLITPWHVITVGNANILLKPSIVRLGENDLSKPDETKIQDIEVARFHRHEQFDMSHFFKNQATSDIGIASLSRKAIITGRGITDILQEGTVNISTSAQCDSADNRRVKTVFKPALKLSEDQHLCATNLDQEKARGSCKGDYGSPLVTTIKDKQGQDVIHYLIGIASFGVNCASKNKDAVEVFVKTSAYIGWIKDTVEKDVGFKECYKGATRLCATLPKDCGRSWVLEAKIANGQPAVENGYPWMALLSYGEGKGRQWLCGGALITKWHVLTAAHCVHPKRPNEVQLGQHLLSSKSDNVQTIAIDVNGFHYHEGFSGGSFKNDIAIVKLAREAVLNKKVAPICLPVDKTLREKDFFGEAAKVAGWGKTLDKRDKGEGVESDVLRHAEMKVTSNKDCSINLKEFQDQFGDEFDMKRLCAVTSDSNKGATFCKGDSGSPLMSANTQETGGALYYAIGIVSTSPLNSCGDASYHGIYVRVTAYLDWIQSHLFIL